MKSFTHNLHLMSSITFLFLKKKKSHSGDLGICDRTDVLFHTSDLLRVSGSVHNLVGLVNMTRMESKQ